MEKCGSEKDKESCGGFMKKPIIITLSLVGIAVLIGTPFLIHFFSPQCSSEITADGLLGYIIQALSAIGTIALAYVAVWQNKQQKEENDAAQKRLEDLTIQANEQYVVGKIIECESARIARLKSLIEEFSLYCKGEQIFSLVIGDYTEDSRRAKSLLSEWRSKLLELMNTLIAELYNDPIVNTDEMRTQTAVLASAATLYIDKLISDVYGSTKESKELKKIFLDYIEFRNKYILLVDQNYSQLVYGNMTLSEIREKYKPHQITEDA